MLEKLFNKKNLLRLVIVLTSLLSIYYIYYLYQAGLITNEHKMREYIANFGFYAPLIFMTIQILGIVYQFIPSGITLVVGVILFGPVYGFIYNYISICLGSFLVFLISKKYGKVMLKGLFGVKFYEKYQKWIDGGEKFDKAFMIMIFLPVAPDDALCYLAGLTKMTFRKFSLVILTAKPASILLYSFGVHGVIKNFLIGG